MPVNTFLSTLTFPVLPVDQFLLIPHIDSLRERTIRGGLPEDIDFFFFSHGSSDYRVKRKEEKGAAIGSTILLIAEPDAHATASTLKGIKIHSRMVSSINFPKIYTTRQL